MCGRYLFAEKPEKIYQRYNITKKTGVDLPTEPQYNIAPGSFVPVIISGKNNNIENMKWGLIPHWSKDPKIGYRLINARSETVDRKPSFKESFEQKRCLIPATGFYEWQKSGQEKTPYLIRLKSDAVFSFAGIYDTWKDAENKEFKTFSIITTEANDLVTKIHNRMPAILSKDEELRWLDRNTPKDELKRFLDPFETDKMEMHKVSNEVNSPKNQDEKITKRV